MRRGYFIFLAFYTKRVNNNFVLGQTVLLLSNYPRWCNNVPMVDVFYMVQWVNIRNICYVYHIWRIFFNRWTLISNFCFFFLCSQKFITVQNLTLKVTVLLVINYLIFLELFSFMCFISIKNNNHSVIRINEESQLIWHSLHRMIHFYRMYSRYFMAYL